MSESSLSVSPVIEPFAGGVLGLGLGYSMAPRKYSLKKLLTMNTDKMKEIYSQDIIKQMSPKEREALEAIWTAKDEFHSSKLQNREEVRQAAIKWQNKFQEIEIPQTLQDSYRENRTILTEALEKENYVMLNKQYRAAKRTAENAPENQMLQKALISAKESFSAVKVRIAGKLENYKNTVRNIHNERLYAIRSNPTKWIGAKEAYKEFLTATARQRTLISNKLFELSNNKDLLKSYNTIKEYLPKARTKAALTGGIIVGGITTLIVTRFSQNVGRA